MSSDALLRAFRTLFGGPSQPEPLDERGGIHRARMLAQNDNRCLNANQYENDGV
jgi:cysteine synthase A